MKYGKFFLDHVKKGEMPWTQWYCCGVVGGVEVCSPSHFPDFFFGGSLSLGHGLGGGGGSEKQRLMEAVRD